MLSRKFGDSIIKLTNHLKMNIHTKTHPYAFVIDIDGTIVVDKKSIPKVSSQSLNLLTENNIPYVLLTNNTANSEQAKAEELNNLLQLSKPLKGEDIILSYTPIKKKLKNMFKKIVMVIGRQTKLDIILPLPFIPYYITIEQYCIIFPESVPLSDRTKNNPQYQFTLKKVCDRLQLKQLDKHQLQISAVIILSTPIKWDESIQVLLDIFSTETGQVTKDTHYKACKPIPIVACLGDYFFTTLNHNLPRMLIMPFIQTFKTVYQQVYKQPIQIPTYGKPNPFVYTFTQQHIENMYGKVNRLVMIGDNPQTDIEGALAAGWDTILVKTGVLKQDYPRSTLNAEDMLQGIKMYLNKQ